MNGALAFLNEALVRQVEAGTADGTSAIESAVVDCANGIDVTFLCTIETANAGNYLKVQQSLVGDGTGMADLEGSKVVAAASGDVVAYEVFRPTKRYLRAVVIRGASTVVGEIYAIQRGPRTMPADNNVDGEIVSEIGVSPAEGTA